MWNDITGITMQFVWHRLEITIRALSCEWNNISQRNIYKGRKKNRSCTWRTTTAKNVRRLLTRCMYAIQNYLSHVPICSINWPIFHSRMYVRPVKSDNDEKIMTTKLNKVTMPERSYATCERSFIGINEWWHQTGEISFPRAYQIEFTGISPSSWIWCHDRIKRV